MIRFCLLALLLIAGWTAPAAAQYTDAAASEELKPLPPDFRGKIRYFGNHTGLVRSIHTFRDGPFKDCVKPSKNCPEQIGGSLQVDLEFQGDIVHGVFRGTGGLRESRLVGRRIGAQCELYDPADGSTWSGICNRRNFNGQVTSVANALVKVDLKFTAVGIEVDDFSDLYDAWRAEVVRVQRYDQLIAQWNGAESAETRFRTAVELSVYGWQLDPYVPGSMGPLTATDENSNTRTLYVEFATESGGRGWARAALAREKVSGGWLAGKKIWVIKCIAFWDTSQCVPFTPPPRPPQPPREPPAPPSTPILMDADGGPRR